MVEGTCRGQEFGSQPLRALEIQGSSQPSVTPVPGDPVPSFGLPRQCVHVCIHMLTHINTHKHKSLRNAEGPEAMLGRERLKVLESLKHEGEFKTNFSYITSSRPAWVD